MRETLNLFIVVWERSPDWRDFLSYEQVGDIQLYVFCLFGS